jgi:7-keto-8-aminopelargonate synthetase-like enzyme
MHKRDDVPEYVRKLLDEGEEAKKRLQKLEDERELQKFEKIARDYSVPASEATALMKLSKADPEALNKLLAHTKAGWAAAQKAGVFAELGATGGNGGDTSAYAEMEAKAAEYHKTHPELSIHQCFEKVYTDPANREIAKRERMESAAPVMMPPGSMR